MIAKTGLLAALTLEAPRKDEERSETGGNAFGRLLETHLHEEVDPPAGPDAPMAARTPARADATESPAPPTTADLARALADRTPSREAVTPKEDEAADEPPADLASAAPAPTPAAATPPPAPVRGAPPAPLLLELPTSAPDRAALPPEGSTPDAQPAAAAPPAAGAAHSNATPKATARDDAKAAPPTSLAPQVAVAPRGPAPSLRENVANRPLKATRAEKEKAPKGAAPGATATPATIAQVLAPLGAPAPAPAAVDQAHTATEPASPGARGPRAGSSDKVQSAPMSPTASEGIEAPAPAPVDASTAAGPDAGADAAASPTPLPADPDPAAPIAPPGAGVPQAILSRHEAPAMKAGPPPAAAPAVAPTSVETDHRPPLRRSGEPARALAGAASGAAPRAEAQAAAAATTSGGPGAGDGRSAAEGRQGREGRDGQAGPERVTTAERRPSPPPRDVARTAAPADDAGPPVERAPLAAKTREPARTAAPADLLPSAAPMVADARPAASTSSTSPAAAPLRHEPVAPGVNVVTLAAATRSEVDIPDLGRIVIAAERRRNRVDLEIHAAEPATVQLLQEKAPDMLHEANRVAQVSAVNVHQSKADEGAGRGSAALTQNPAGSSAGSGGHGARQERHAPEGERVELDIPAPVAAAGGRVRFVL